MELLLNTYKNTDVMIPISNTNFRNKKVSLINLVGQLNQVSPARVLDPLAAGPNSWLSLTSLQFFSVSLSLQQKIPSAPEHFHYTIFLILERL